MREAEYGGAYWIEMSRSGARVFHVEVSFSCGCEFRNCEGGGFSGF